MMTDTNYLSDLAIPPGEYLEEVLDELSITQSDLAKRMGRPAQAISEIVKGAKAITPETAFTSVNVPLHPGAARYYKEAGIDVPEAIRP